jgi:predicted dehydrogenase
MREVTVDDVSFVWLEFENGAMGSLEASRVSTGRKSMWNVEVYGSKGAISFDLNRCNELLFYSSEDSLAVQGFRKIIVTEADEHEFIKYWWPAGHMLGWEHHHCNAIFHFVDCVANNKDVTVGATFLDGLRCQEVVEAALLSATQGRWVDVEETR